MRPGTTVCLLCRREARLAAQRRHRRIIARVLAAALTLGVVAVLGVSAASSLRDHRTRVLAAAGQLAPSAPAAPVPTSAPPPPPSTSSDSSLGVVSTAAAAPAEPARPDLSPIIAEGRSELAESTYAVRTGDTVRVVFDTELGRTRRPEKFERIVRETLSAVYGPAADSGLAMIRPGALAEAGDLLTDLPMRGVEIPLPDGRSLALWPETRQGRDGPLVVRYRAVVRQ
jgi:hypothetical protein